MAVKFDYQSVYNRLANRMQKLSGDADVLSFSSAGLFLSAIAEAINQLAQYNDYWTREAIYSTAQNLSSVMGQVQFRGYKPKRAAGSAGFCVFSTNPDFVTAKEWNQDYTYSIGDKVLRKTSETNDTIKMYECIADNTVAFDPRNDTEHWAYVSCKYPDAAITIPKRTRVTGGGLVFVTTSDVILEPTMDYVGAAIKQGIPKTRELPLTPLAGGFQTTHLEDHNIEQYLYSVFVDGEEYTEIQNIYHAKPEQKVFQIDTLHNLQGVRITFGNGQFGFTPSAKTCQFKYLETAGLAGEVRSSGVIKTVADSITAIVNGETETIPLYCNNVSECTGSYNGDGIEEIKYGGIAAYQTQERAVTQKDYQTLLTNHASIEKCIVWGSYDDYCDTHETSWDSWVQENENKIHIAAYTPKGSNLPKAAQEEILRYLKGKKSSLDVLVFEDVEFIDLAFSVLAYISSSAIKETVNAEIISYLSSTYALSQNYFKKPLYDTVWKGGLSRIPGIIHHTSLVTLSKETTFDKNSNFQLNTSLPFNLIDQTSYELWIKDKTSELPSFIQAGKMHNSQWAWMNGFTSTGGSKTSASQFSPQGTIAVSGNVVRMVDGQNVLAGRAPEDFVVRIYYTLGKDNNNQKILDIVPTKRNQIIRFSEMRSVASVYA